MSEWQKTTLDDALTDSREYFINMAKAKVAEWQIQSQVAAMFNNPLTQENKKS